MAAKAFPHVFHHARRHFAKAVFLMHAVCRMKLTQYNSQSLSQTTYIQHHAAPSRRQIRLGREIGESFAEVWVPQNAENTRLNW